MNYLSSENKNWKYHLKSAAMTFLSTFCGVLALALLPYHQMVVTLKPEDLNWALLVAGGVMFIRLLFISVLTTAVEIFIKKFKK